jgi:hypothetical protein
MKSTVDKLKNLAILLVVCTIYILAMAGGLKECLQNFYHWSDQITSLFYLITCVSVSTWSVMKFKETFNIK